MSTIYSRERKTHTLVGTLANIYGFIHSIYRRVRLSFYIIN